MATVAGVAVGTPRALAARAPRAATVAAPPLLTSRHTGCAVALLRWPDIVSPSGRRYPTRYLT